MSRKISTAISAEFKTEVVHELTIKIVPKIVTKEF